MPEWRVRYREVEISLQMTYVEWGGRLVGLLGHFLWERGEQGTFWLTMAYRPVKSLSSPGVSILRQEGRFLLLHIRFCHRGVWEDLVFWLRCSNSQQAKRLWERVRKEKPVTEAILPDGRELTPEGVHSPVEAPIGKEKAIDGDQAEAVDASTDQRKKLVLGLCNDQQFLRRLMRLFLDQANEGYLVQRKLAAIVHEIGGDLFAGLSRQVVAQLVISKLASSEESPNHPLIRIRGNGGKLATGYRASLYGKQLAEGKIDRGTHNLVGLAEAKIGILKDNLSTNREKQKALLETLESFRQEALTLEGEIASLENAIREAKGALEKLSCMV